jgi:molybdate transport system substrate-binding protein
MRLAALLFLLLTAPSWGSVAAPQPVRIAVAANFKATLQNISRQFEQQSGIRVVFSSASTGVLASQIKYGAPFDLFFAADRETPSKLKLSGHDSAGKPFCYATGRLVLAGGSSKLTDLAQPDLSLAIANPATAPYGRAAMEVLSRAEFRAGESRKLVRGTNVIQAYQFWHSGAVELALIPQAIAPETATIIPAAWHQPLEQHALVLRRSPNVDAYLNWFRSDNVRTLITQAGYEPCP